AVADGVEELVRVPARSQWSGLGLAVADDGCDDQVGIVERGAEGMRERITQFAALVDRTGRFRRYVAGDSARKGKLLEQPLHALLVLGNVRVDLAVRPLQVGISHQARPA